MHVERGLIGPELQQRELVGVQDALEDLELLTSRLLHDLLASLSHRLRQFGALAGRRGYCHDESDGHLISSEVAAAVPSLKGRRPVADWRLAQPAVAVCRLPNAFEHEARVDYAVGEIVWNRGLRVTHRVARR
jgi:hypothetical protein